MKKNKLLFIILLIFIGIKSVNALDTTEKVYDYAQVLTPTQEEKLKQSVTNYINTYDIDMVLVTVRHHTKSDTKSYAEYFYDYNDFGFRDTKDGIIFVIDFTFGDTDLYISPIGSSINIYNNNRIKNIISNITSKKNKSYYEMFNIFIKQANNYAKDGKSDVNYNIKTNSNNAFTYKEVISWVVIIIISIIIPSMIVYFLIRKNKLIKKNKCSIYYLKGNNVKINSKTDKFLTTHTTSYRIDETTKKIKNTSNGNDNSVISNKNGVTKSN